MTISSAYSIIRSDMFVRIKKSGPRQYLELVESYREDGKVRQRVLLNLGRLDFLRDTNAAELIAAALAKYSDEVAVISALRQDNQSVVWDKEWGAYLVFRKLWRDVGLEQIINSKKRGTRYGFDVEKALFYTVLHRLTETGSDLAASKWLEGIYDPEEVKIKYHHLLRAMGFIEQFKEDIEQELFLRNRTLFEDSLDLVFFDTTSIYFEGEGPQGFAEYGYSKDHRPDRKQIVVGVVMTRSGEPLCCEWWPGNMSDVKALIDVIGVLKGRFAIGRVTLVCDRGMVSAKNLRELRKNKIDYIVGVKLRGLKRVREEVLSRGGRYHEVAPNLRVKEVKLGTERYIVCVNPEEVKKDEQARRQMVESLAEKLKRGAKGLIGNKGYRRYLKIERDAVQLDRDRLKQESRYDGKYVITTSTDLPAGDVACTYKSLWQVEYAFRTLKDVLRSRPVFHRSEVNVKGHVFCSYLALCLLVRLRRLLEERGEVPVWGDLIRDLRNFRAMKIEVSDKEYIFRTRLRGVAHSAFQAVGQKVPPSVVKL